MNKKPIVCVVGSINMDLMLTVDQMPEQGETIEGVNFATYPGGKGANQAVAAARLGAEVQMVGAVGGDAFGGQLIHSLEKEGMDTNGIHVAPEDFTGISTIILSNKDNRIIYTPGANHLVDASFIENSRERIKNSDILLLQLETPMEAVLRATAIAKAHNIPVIVNPAPYQELPDDLLKEAAYITPNETEMEHMKKLPLFDAIQEKLVVTQGNKGVQIYGHSIPGYSVDVEDTTGAGDTFNGALAAAIGSGDSLEKAAAFANAAAALSITKIGAQAGMPKREEAEQFIQRKHKKENL